MRLRVDPWDPEYGASTEIETYLEEAVGLDLTAEVGGEWRPIAPGEAVELPCVAFIDGVRRVEVRLFAEDDGVEAPGLLGSWAAGCAWSTQPPRIGTVEAGRELVLGAGLAHEPLTVHVGGCPLTFEPRSVPGDGPLDPLRGLQNAMREAEAALATRVLEADEAELVVSDGPLNYFLPGPAIGLVKRQARSYLDPARSSILTALTAGERTPIFRLGEQRLERYSWYLRLTEPRRIDGPLAGLVRLEVAAVAGLQHTQELAAMVGACLPRFASHPGHDPRAPQNLYPVGALETRLRNQLGDAGLIHRATEMHLFEEVQRA